MAADKQRKPNIVFIFIDDLGWCDVGYQGSQYYETPNIDKLAGEGMVFTDAYSNAANCAPTRACLMSGQYSPRHGVYTVGSSVRGEAALRKIIPIKNKTELNPKIVTIAEAIKPAGYVSACIGKWHLGESRKCNPKAQGFDVWVSTNNAPGKGRDDPKTILGFTDAAVDFIEQNQDKPFFLYLAHHAVHSPWKARRNLISKYEKKKPWQGHNNPTYAAMIEATDESVGRIVGTIDRLGLAKNTLVVFFGDNGGVGPITSMAPLRGAKGMFYEGGIREPLVMRWPGVIKQGSRCRTPVIGIDFYPTFLELSQAAKPAGQALDGQSLVPLLHGKRLKERALHWHFPCYLGSWAFVEIPWRTTPVAVVRKGRYKLMEFFEDGRFELYDLREDIGETRNLADSMPEKVKELHGIMLAWRKEINAPVPSEPNPLYDPKAKYKANPASRGKGVHIFPQGLDSGNIKLLRRQRGY